MRLASICFLCLAINMSCATAIAGEVPPAPAFASERDEKGLLEAIRGSVEHGLDPSWYNIEAIERLGAEMSSASGEDKARIAAERDGLMSEAFLQLASHLDAGVENPYFSNANQRRPESGTDLAALLTQALERHDVKGTLDGLAPQTADYRQLMAALKKTEKWAAETVWPKVPETGARKIEPGQQDPRIPAVRARLEAEDFLKRPRISEEANSSEAVNQGDIYDEDLVQAVLRFQEKYGLGADGVIGRWTLAAMNVEPSFRICQVKVNLDRLRALKHVITTERYAMVNVPDFSLTIYEGGAPIKQMKVITGMLDRKSPLMSDNIRFIVFSPKWHVPRSIAVKDKLPKIKKDPSYIRKMGMRLFTVGESGMEEVDPESVDWETVDSSNFSYRIVQEARDDNALGRVKFMFPNRHDVYLHDTPTKSLFDSGVRVFSSGCIRISDPIWFAEYLLKDKGDWSRERIDAAMKRESPMDVTLTEPMPIHILYITARADANGDPIFRHDVYGFDRTLSKKLCGN